VKWLADTGVEFIIGVIFGVLALVSWLLRPRK